jgi:hypothetical protein
MLGKMGVRGNQIPRQPEAGLARAPVLLDGCAGLTQLAGRVRE